MFASKFFYFKGNKRSNQIEHRQDSIFEEKNSDQIRTWQILTKIQIQVTEQKNDHFLGQKKSKNFIQRFVMRIVQHFVEGKFGIVQNLQFADRFYDFKRFRWSLSRRN